MNYNLKYIINNQQELINKQQDNIKDLIRRIEALENKNKENIIEKMDENNGLNDSLILLNNNKSKISIKNWINKEKEIKFNLIFKKLRW